MSSPGIFKQCTCRDLVTGRLLAGRCPRLLRGEQWSLDHGSWGYRIDLPRHRGSARRQITRRGFATCTEAEAQLTEIQNLLDLAGRDRGTHVEVADIIEPAIRHHRRLPTPYELHRQMSGNRLPAVPLTVAEYLTGWIAEKEALATIRDSTISIYETHLRCHLVPHLGHLTLAELRPQHIRAMLIASIDHNQTIETGLDSDGPPPRAGRTTGSATRQRILATLRNALNDAIADELVTKNPAVGVKTSARPPTPRI